MKSERLVARVTETAKETIQRASSILGVEMSEFVVSVSLEKAREVIEQEQVLRLDETYLQKFHELLAQPVSREELSPALIAAFNQYGTHRTVPKRQARPK